jgi:uncharacterized surface protein with fasciclin (FAS1) repeats
MKEQPMKMQKVVWTAAAFMTAGVRALPGSALAQEPSGNLVETADAAGSFTTLLAAAESTGLVETRKADGSSTVFAPTDDAFDTLPADTFDGLPANPAALPEVLLYQVVAGEVLAAYAVGLTSATTVQGSDGAIEVAGDGVVLNGSANLDATARRYSVLLIAIDSMVARSSERSIVIAGFPLSRAYELQDALQFLLEKDPDLIIFCPDGFPSSGYAVQELQAFAPMCPVVVLCIDSSRGITEMLDAGADPDGYLSAGLSTREMGAYLQAIARRYQPVAPRLV